MARTESEVDVIDSAPFWRIEELQVPLDSAVDYIHF
jgi:hypothetical protein